VRNRDDEYLAEAIVVDERGHNGAIEQGTAGAAQPRTVVRPANRRQEASA
jgi:hypothetical protein